MTERLTRATTIERKPHNSRVLSAIADSELRVIAAMLESDTTTEVLDVEYIAGVVVDACDRHKLSVDEMDDVLRILRNNEQEKIGS